MKTFLRIVLWLVLLLAVALGTLVGVGSLRLNRAVEVAEHPAPTPATSSAAVEEGRRLADIFVCTECHGGGLEGTDFLDGGPFMRLPAPNLTGGRVSPMVLERAVRHGVGSNGIPLVIMPSEAYVDMADQDLAAIAGWMATLPATDTPLMERSVGPIGRAVAAFQAPVLQPARRMEQPTVHPREPGPPGERFGPLCSVCHGADYGGQVFEAEKRYWAANLTSHETGAGSWSLEAFTRAVRAGQTPDGRTLDPTEMPWRGFARLTDDEVRDLWMFLRDQPPVDRPRPPEFAVEP